MSKTARLNNIRVGDEVSLVPTQGGYQTILAGKAIKVTATQVVISDPENRNGITYRRSDGMPFFKCDQVFPMRRATLIADHASPAHGNECLPAPMDRAVPKIKTATTPAPRHKGAQVHREAPVTGGIPEALAARAIVIADHHMRELLLSSGHVHEEHDLALVSPTDEAGKEVTSIDAAADSIREALDWLLPRGIAEILDTPHGQVIHLLPD